jgi:membrane protease YdiL (CAAX protease family)
MKMKATLTAVYFSVATMISFIFTYFFNLTIANSDQYLGLIAVVLLDGFFGMVAGIKREGFKTFKALKVLRTLVTWIIFLTTLLIIERGFPGTSWLSETILIPFIVFQVISALKNASMIGWIKSELLNNILDKIDNHKGDRV